MLILVFIALLAHMVLVNSTLIPFIDNAILVPISIANSTVLDNGTCDECLCKSNFSYLALNCFPNNTCEFFSIVPRTYSIQSTPQGRLYFPQQTLPNASQCCIPDLNYVLSKLQNATPTYAYVKGPRCLALDNHGYIVTDENVPYLDRFDAGNLSNVSRTLFFSNTSQSRNMAYHNGAYYIGIETNQVVIVDSDNLTVINTITSSYINGPRDIMFLNNGYTMVVVSTGTNYLVFFNQSSSTPLNYTYVYQQKVSYVNPHGLWRVNDSFFYATSWAKNTIYSYSANSENSTYWTESLVINASATNTGDHVTIDECDRRWFSLETTGIKIFDIYGNWIGNFTFPNSSIFDTMITDNYVMYLSDTLSNRIIRIDPNIEC